MRIERGNMLDLAEQGMFDVVIHGCNCFCTFGAGIAKEIKDRYPEVYAADLVTSTGDESKLGTIRSVLLADRTPMFTVVNAYTQYDYRSGRNAPRKTHTDYNAVRSCFRAIKKEFYGKRIAYPLIGCGLGGGDWADVSNIIIKELQGEDHTLVLLPSNRRSVPCLS